MIKRPLTKSRFNLATECPTKLYYNDRPTEYGNDKLDVPFLKNLARGGFQVGALAKLYFPGGVEVTTRGYEDSLAATNELLKKDIVTIFEAAFVFENLFIRADVVRKEGNALYLYEVKAKSYDPEDPGLHLAKWKPYLSDVAFQHHVIASAHPEWKVVPHLMLTNKRARTTVEGLNQRFRIVDNRVVVTPGFDVGDEILIRVDVSEQVAEIQDEDFAPHLRMLADAYLNDRQIPPKPSGGCNDCQFRIDKAAYPAGTKSGFEECWVKALAIDPTAFETRVPIFAIWKLQAAKLIADGVYFIDELHEEDLKPKREPKADKAGLSTAQRKVLQWQRMLQGGEAYFDKANFASETADYRYPLHFIDFETTTVAIPFNKGRRPYETIAFQFSHHTLAEYGTVTHAHEWISTEAGKFPNFDFVRALKAALAGDDGTIFRYAAHENTVLCQIRQQLLSSEEPDREALVEWIESITTPTKSSGEVWEPKRAMVDMLDLVQRFFWHPRMAGSNSIKVVLPAMLDASAYLRELHASWIKVENGKVVDPYKLLEPVFDSWERNDLDRLYSDEDLADGGAAMMAYAKMQFTEMSDAERKQITSALLRYCKLDTLAMVMLWQGWTHWE